MLDSCFGFRLQTGVIIIGALNVIGSVCFLIILAYAFADNAVEVEFEVENENVKVQYAHIWLCFAMLVMVTNLMAAIIMTTGALKKSHSLMRFWLTVAGLEYSFHLIYMLNGCKPMNELIGLFISFVLGCYFWCVVYSLYKELKANSKSPRYIPANARKMQI